MCISQFHTPPSTRLLRSYLSDGKSEKKKEDLFDCLLIGFGHHFYKLTDY